MNTRKRIGFFGGSFDPPHNGHFICARAVAESLRLEKIVIIPAAIQPHKPDGPIVSADLRLEMIEAAIRNDPLFGVSRVELDRQGVSYTVNTLEALIKTYPPDTYETFWLMGTDSAHDIASWKFPDRIVELTQIAVMQRHGYSSDNLPEPWSERMIAVETPVIEISSTDIRDRLKRDLSVKYLTAPPVEKLINQNGLYC